MMVGWQGKRKKEKYCWLQHRFCCNILEWVEKIIVIEKPLNVHLCCYETNANQTINAFAM
jgi:hypothetical protein